MDIPAVNEGHSKFSPAVNTARDLEQVGPVIEGIVGRSSNTVTANEQRLIPHLVLSGAAQIVEVDFRWRQLLQRSMNLAIPRDVAQETITKTSVCNGPDLLFNRLEVRYTIVS